jgi:hypothetical protein
LCRSRDDERGASAKPQNDAASLPRPSCSGIKDSRSTSSTTTRRAPIPDDTAAAVGPVELGARQDVASVLEAIDAAIAASEACIIAHQPGADNTPPSAHTLYADFGSQPAASRHDTTTCSGGGRTAGGVGGEGGGGAGAEALSLRECSSPQLRCFNSNTTPAPPPRRGAGAEALTIPEVFEMAPRVSRGACARCGYLVFTDQVWLSEVLLHLYRV